jgi:hypothetical protein
MTLLWVAGMMEAIRAYAFLLALHRGWKKSLADPVGISEHATPLPAHLE